MPTKKSKKRSAAIDARLARVHQLIEDVALNYEKAEDSQHLMQEVLLGAVDWSMVDLSVRKQIFTLLMADSTDRPEMDPSCEFDERRRVAIMKVVEREHLDMCLCCRNVAS